MDIESTGSASGRSQGSLNAEATMYARMLMTGPSSTSWELPYDLIWFMEKRIVGGRVVGFSKPDRDGWYTYTSDGLEDVVPIRAHQKVPPPELLALHHHKQFPSPEFVALVAMDLPGETRFPAFLHWSEAAKGSVLRFRADDFSEDLARVRIARCAALLGSGPRGTVSSATARSGAPDYLQTWLETKAAERAEHPVIRKGSYRGAACYHFSVRHPRGAHFSDALRRILRDLGFVVVDDPRFTESDSCVWFASHSKEHLDEVIRLVEGLADTPEAEEKALDQKLAEVADVHWFAADWRFLDTEIFSELEKEFGIRLYWTAEMDAYHLTLVKK